LRYLPINLNVQDQLCLVVGGGEVGQRKVQNLLQCGARVRLVSREMTRTLRDLVETGQVEHLGHEYRREHLKGIALAFICTDDPDVNTRASLDAREQGIWVNVADTPALCNFILPATVSRGDLTISVSTSGSSPALAARIRGRLEREYGPEYGRFLELMQRIRARIKAEGRPTEENRKIFFSLLDSDLLKAITRNDPAGIEKILSTILGPGYTLSSLGFKAEEEEKT